MSCLKFTVHLVIVLSRILRFTLFLKFKFDRKMLSMFGKSLFFNEINRPAMFWLVMLWTLMVSFDRKIRFEPKHHHHSPIV
jgi:hypothetical protein